MAVKANSRFSEKLGSADLPEGADRVTLEPLSDAVIASRQMNPRLVMLLRELDGFLRSARQFGCERK